MIDSLLAGQNSEIYMQSLSNEWGRLSQGNDFGIQYTNTIKFILKTEVPYNKKVTYATIVYNYRPLKD